LTLVGPSALAALGAWGLLLGPFWPLWFWLRIAQLAHVATDVWFYRRSVQLLWPLSRQSWGVGLVGWHDLVPTLALYGALRVAVVWPTVATYTRGPQA